ncbi:MAG: hypothetical protein J5524_03765 [Bacteroidaceae bacterium]|nr:hypothetical protein [Bacteroidaceae bacterium]
MNTVIDVNRVKAYLEGVLWAAYGVKVITGNVAEWQIDAVKECAKELKEKEIEHSSLSSTEKQTQKRLWKQWIDEITKGFKDVLRSEGRMV